MITLLFDRPSRDEACPTDGSFRVNVPFRMLMFSDRSGGPRPEAGQSRKGVRKGRKQRGSFTTEYTERFTEDTKN